MQVNGQSQCLYCSISLIWLIGSFRTLRNLSKGRWTLQINFSCCISNQLYWYDPESYMMIVSSFRHPTNSTSHYMETQITPMYAFPRLPIDDNEPSLLPRRRKALYFRDSQIQLIYSDMSKTWCFPVAVAAVRPIWRYLSVTRKFSDSGTAGGSENTTVGARRLEDITIFYSPTHRRRVMPL